MPTFEAHHQVSYLRTSAIPPQPPGKGLDSAHFDYQPKDTPQPTYTLAETLDVFIVCIDAVIPTIVVVVVE